MTDDTQDTYEAHMAEAEALLSDAEAIAGFGLAQSLAASDNAVLAATHIAMAREIREAG